MAKQIQLPPRLIENEIENFLDNFKYTQSLLDNGQAPLDCRLDNLSSENPALRYSTSSTDSSSYITSSVSGPKQSITSPSDNRFSSLTSSILSSEMPSFDLDPECNIVSSGVFGGGIGSDLSASFASAIEIGLGDQEGNFLLGLVPGDVMAGSSCTVTIIEVAEIIQSKYAFLSGGKSRRNFPLVTFAECPTAGNVTDDQYKNVVSYLSGVLPATETELGFVIIIDRRGDKWGAVKTLLLRISGFFPSLVQKIYLLQPTGFLQKTFSDASLKFLRDDFRFKVLLLNTLDELHDHIDKEQLTSDLGGSLIFNVAEWVQHRAALEKLSSNITRIADTLKVLCARLQETEFPNDVSQTDELIQDHEVVRQEIVEDIESTISHGEGLLECFHTVRDSEGEEVVLQQSAPLPRFHQEHLGSAEKLLGQLSATSKNFEKFWNHHKQKLQQCLQLRKFEEEFKHLQFSGEKHLFSLSLMTEGGSGGESLIKVETLLSDLQQFEASTKGDIDSADELRERGEKFIENHYAVDCIKPKCLELERISLQYRSILATRYTMLRTSKELLDKIDKANRWCTRGVDLLANQQIEKFTTDTEVSEALEEIKSFINISEELKLDNPSEFHSNYDDIMSTDMLEASTAVLSRFEDVRALCEKRRSSLQIMADKASKPKLGEALTRIMSTRVTNGDHKHTPSSLLMAPEDEPKKKRAPSLKIKHESKLGRSLSKSSFYLNSSHSQPAENNTILEKRKLVMEELIDTERQYVDELRSILQGYAWQMDKPEMQILIPSLLKENKQVLFGNLDEIFNFHSKVFLTELEDCEDTPTLIGACFVKRTSEFQMYSTYCQNKIASEELRRKIGDNNPFFKECQRRLDHKLPLAAYLLQPVQRITKYQLLLKEMLKFAAYDSGCDDLRNALDTMLSVVKHVNDVMHQISIKGFEGDLSEQGRLLMQGSFSVWSDQKKHLRDLRFKPMSRHIFLYEKIVLFCKKKDEATQNGEKAVYMYKSSLPTSQIGLTETVKNDKKKFELSLHGRSQVYIIQAPSVEVKAAWVSEIKNVLVNQFDDIKVSRKANNGFLGHDLESNHFATTDDLALHADNNNIYHDGDKRGKSLKGSKVGRSPTMDSIKSPIRSLMRARTEIRKDQIDKRHGNSYNHNMDSDEDDQDTSPTESLNSRYIVISDYVPLNPSDPTLREGQAVQLLDTRGDGMWRIRTTSQSGARIEGWVESSYLEEESRRSSGASNQSLQCRGSLTSNERTIEDDDRSLAMMT